MANHSYNYSSMIKAPSELGMSSEGSIGALSRDIDGLIAYTEILVSGKSKASRGGGALGNKYFLNTGAQCNAKDTKQQTDRYIYINNIPTGNIPLISSAMGTNFKDFKGLIPGITGNLSALDPFALVNAFSAGSNPECQKITMDTVDVNNNKSAETHYVTLADIEDTDACLFPNKRNPITNKKCSESFTDYTDDSVSLDAPHFIGLAVLSLFILYRIMDNN
jgi:hypothetical protein